MLSSFDNYYIPSLISLTKRLCSEIKVSRGKILMFALFQLIRQFMLHGFRKMHKMKCYLYAIVCFRLLVTRATCESWVF